jgi:GxxExxY protein
MESQFLFKQETYAIIGAALEVHKYLGYGFLEAVYKEALEYEFQLRKINYVREKEFTIIYKGLTLNKKYYSDYLIDNKIILEVKAASDIVDAHVSQTLNYIKAGKVKLGLLINFGSESLEWKRLII